MVFVLFFNYSVWFVRANYLIDVHLWVPRKCSQQFLFSVFSVPGTNVVVVVLFSPFIIILLLLLLLQVNITRDWVTAIFISPVLSYIAILYWPISPYYSLYDIKFRPLYFTASSSKILENIYWLFSFHWEDISCHLIFLKIFSLRIY